MLAVPAVPISTGPRLQENPSAGQSAGRENNVGGKCNFDDAYAEKPVSEKNPDSQSQTTDTTAPEEDKNTLESSGDADVAEDEVDERSLPVSSTTPPSAAETDSFDLETGNQGGALGEAPDRHPSNTPEFVSWVSEFAGKDSLQPMEQSPQETPEIIPADATPRQRAVPAPQPAPYPPHVASLQPTADAKHVEASASQTSDRAHHVPATDGLPDDKGGGDVRSTPLAAAKFGDDPAANRRWKREGLHAVATSVEAMSARTSDMPVQNATPTLVSKTNAMISRISDLAGRDENGLDLQPLQPEELEPRRIGEVRTFGQPSQVHALSRPEMPILIGRQLAEAFHRQPDKLVEVMLSPEELGRVRLSISTSETGITVNVLAERPETLALMRRHISQLASEFSAIGYADIAFSFAEGRSNPDRKSGRLAETKGKSFETVTVTEAGPADAARLSPVAAGLDIRL